jgi:tetratricopeptide (TPR) repeat protein
LCPKAEEDPITPICKLSLCGIVAASLILPAGAAPASTDDRALLSAYARARVADSPGKAAESYAAALALSPDNEVLAARALSQAMAAGNRQLAVRAARILEKKGQLAPDATLLLLSEALRTKDWKRATSYVERIRKDEVFAFMAPVLQAWLAHGSKRGDPLAILKAGEGDQLAAGYAAEHRPLLLIARGDEKQGIPELLAVVEGAGGRANRLRVAAAATLARRDRQAALALLQGDREPLIAARRLIESRKPVPGAIDSAATGVAEFLIRIAVDLNAQQVDQLALSYARLATFLAPDNSETWLIASALLADQGRHDEALALLGNISPQDPFFGGVADRRIALLSASGRKDSALAEAKALADAPAATATDWVRLGDLHSELQRHDDAAAAYERAIALARAGGSREPEWMLWLLRGGALERADRWPEAKAALEAANRLDPKQPLVLNYLGYSQLERRENVEEAMRLVEEASRLQPDSPEITDSLGWAHYLRGNVKGAIPLLERAAAARPADVEINEHLGDAYYTAGRRFEARYAWEAALLNAKDENAERLRAKIGTGLTPQLASP